MKLIKYTSELDGNNYYRCVCLSGIFISYLYTPRGYYIITSEDAHDFSDSNTFKYRDAKEEMSFLAKEFHNFKIYELSLDEFNKYVLVGKLVK
jgi:hypothetical protein